jgi:hypothetical protein
MLSDESAQNDGYCLEGKCVGCINDPQCTASQTDACIVSECHPTEYFCLDIVEPPDSAPVTEGTTHWSLEACTDQTPDDCWAPTCTLNSTDFALNGCLQNFLPRTGEACATLNGQNRECLEESGSCDETGACILDAKADGTACTASETEECTIANAICDNGSCAQNPTYESLGTACTDTDTNECTVARCDGAGTCDQNAANVAADIACTDTDTNDCKIAQCDGAGACDQNAANVANGTACTMLSNANLPNASNDPPSQDPGPDTLAGICASGICVNDDDAPTECEAEDDCKSPLHCCTAHALEANDGECGAQNKNICVECLSDGDCTKAGEGCCQGSCKKDCTRSAGVGEK